MPEYVHQRCKICGEDSFQAQFFIARDKRNNDIVTGYICPKCNEKVKKLNLMKEKQRMKVFLLESTAFPHELCGQAAAICTNSDNYESALKHAVESGHTSVLEHAVFTFRVEGLSRAALAQLTRHRLASFDVQSQRYVKLNNWDAVIPKSIVNSDLCFEADECIRKSMEMYQKLIDAGIPAEDARYVTPQAITTNLIMTMNARELLHFFSLRTCNRAQWEIRKMADEMLFICKKVAPEIFDNAGPGCVTGKCPEKKPCGLPRLAGEWNPKHE